MTTCLSYSKLVGSVPTRRLQWVNCASRFSDTIFPVRNKARLKHISNIMNVRMTTLKRFSSLDTCVFIWKFSFSIAYVWCAGQINVINCTGELRSQHSVIKNKKRTNVWEFFIIWNRNHCEECREAIYDLIFDEKRNRCREKELPIEVDGW